MLQHAIEQRQIMTSLPPSRNLLLSYERVHFFDKTTPVLPCKQEYAIDRLELRSEHVAVAPNRALDASTSANDATSLGQTPIIHVCQIDDGLNLVITSSVIDGSSRTLPTGVLDNVAPRSVPYLYLVKIKQEPLPLHNKNSRHYKIQLKFLSSISYRHR
jgi:hypothetical protein